MLLSVNRKLLSKKNGKEKENNITIGFEVNELVNFCG